MPPTQRAEDLPSNKLHQSEKGTHKILTNKSAMAKFTINKLVRDLKL